MVSTKQFTSLYRAKRLICLLLLFILANTVTAQGNNIQIELVAETVEGNALLHIRLPRGQMIEEAILSQDDAEIALESDIVALPTTQFIILDASNDMINLQSVVQTNMSRFWRNSDSLTSLIFFDELATILHPSNRIDDIDNFLSDYTIIPGSSACLAEAIDTINDIQRDFDRSWRILLVTTGDFSRQANCRSQNFDTLPAPLDVIAITDTLDNSLQDLVDRSSGQIYSANLRSVEARTNEVLSQWGQMSYALRGTLPDTWNSEESFELDILLSNGAEESISLNFRAYNVPIPATPTIAISTLTPTVMSLTEEGATTITSDNSTPIPTPVPQVDTSASETSNDNSVAILLIVGAVLFVIGAVVLALALSRVRRKPDIETSPNPNFYQTLDTNTAQQETLDIADAPITRIAMSDDEHDDLLVTQVLSDERFRNMMEQSRDNEEIIGWMRLVSHTGERDFELTSRGAVIGRSQECDIQITGDGAISRKHARLDVRNNKQVTISRLSAVNPVLVSGIQINNRHPLSPNDVIHLSDETHIIYIAKDSDDIGEENDTKPQDF